MYILGINCYGHGSSAALIKDGEIRFTIEQERLDRIKYSPDFPGAAIAECLKFEGITIEQVDRITFFSQPHLEILQNFPHFVRYFPQSLNLLKSPSGQDSMGFFEKIKLMYTVRGKLKKYFNAKNVAPVDYFEHHLCHAASAFYVSEFDEAAILTVDGRGEFQSTLMAHGKENSIKKLAEVKVPHSLGHFYAAITHHLGFKPFSDEWKVMGMAAYGSPTLLSNFTKLVELRDDGTFRLDLSYMNFHTHGRLKWVSDRFVSEFGPARKKTDPIEQHHLDMAMALQKTVEKAGVHLANRLYQLTKLPSLCLTGGVALNVLMNKCIIEQTPFKNFFIQPIASDSGTSLGGALLYYHQVIDGKRNHPFKSIYLGPGYSDDEILRVLKQKNVPFIKPQKIAADTAKLIADGKIVGWFQGRMEAGPRALGNRSIIANPMLADMKDRLNARVKRRESFRPFAPSILEEFVDDYFDMPKKQLSPYMILAGDVKPDKTHIIPAVTHADNTARVHTVSKESNPRYWELIHEFQKLTGVPVVLNTSFNENEPIVCNPTEAVECFLRTDFDALAIGDYLAIKS